jgi:hypothetical protein
MGLDEHMTTEEAAYFMVLTYLVLVLQRRRGPFHCARWN